MYNTNYLNSVIGHVVEFSAYNKVIIHFELNGALQTAFLRASRFYKDGKPLYDNEALEKFLRIGHMVQFSCHLNDKVDPGQCRWFIISCWRLVESELNTVVMSSGMMNVAGIITDLKQRHGILMMTDMLGNDHKVHFLGSKVYLFGKRLSAPKPLTNQLHVDDKVYFDAIPCFPEENNHRCNWFATCVHKGKKPEVFYTEQNKTEAREVDQDKMLSQYGEAFKADEKPFKGQDNWIDGVSEHLPKITLSTEGSPFYLDHEGSPVPELDSTANVYDKIFKQTQHANEEKRPSDVSSLNNIKEPNPCAKMLQDIKLLTKNPRLVFAQSEGVILDIINDEYGVILGEFQRNVFQSILFHRSNAFLFKMCLAHSKLSEIFIEGDRVRFIAVYAPKQFVCDWIATQVCVASHEEEQDEDEDLTEEDLTDSLFD